MNKMCFIRRKQKEIVLDKDLKKVIGITVLVGSLCGFHAMIQMWESVFQVIVAFFPFIARAGKMALKEYVTSPYFIVSIIMSVASGFGIWFGVKGGKALFFIVSIICEVASLVSIFANVW